MEDTRLIKWLFAPGECAPDDGLVQGVRLTQGRPARSCDGPARADGYSAEHCPVHAEVAATSWHCLGAGMTLPDRTVFEDGFHDEFV